jgi:hypothetical protein
LVVDVVDWLLVVAAGAGCGAVVVVVVLSLPDPYALP